MVLISLSPQTTHYPVFCNVLMTTDPTNSGKNNEALWDRQVEKDAHASMLEAFLPLRQIHIKASVPVQ